MINFPAAPTNGQQFTSGGVTWTFDGTKWTPTPTAGPGYMPITGGTFTGNITAPGETLTGPLTGTTANFSGAVNGTSALFSGGGRFGGNLDMDHPAVSDHFLTGRVGGLARWTIDLGDNTAEGGANTGSNFNISSYTDAGVALLAAVTINRATDQTTFNATGNAQIILGGLNGSSRAIQGNTGYQAGSPRWLLQLGNTTAEGGANAGSDYALNGYTDAGAFLNQPMLIKRSTGVCTFSVAIVNSDRRLKENIAPITGALAKVEQLQGVTYNLIAGHGKQQVGLIAQDVEAVLPEVVVETSQPLDTNGNPIEGEEPLLGIAYGNLVAVLIEAVKELSAKVAALEAA